MDINEKLKELFPEIEYSLDKLQEESIRNIVCKNNNTLSIIPTGGGKSIIYWLSGLILGGMTIVISPLISLMEEQASKLEEHGYNCLLLHSQKDANEQSEKLIEIAKCEYTPNFIFVGPERLSTDGLLEYCLKKRNNDVKLFVIDEVHCVSQWGEMFRPMYKRIKDFILNIYSGNYSNARVLALTATLNSKEIEDISNEFEIETEDIIRDKNVIRKEITLKTTRFESETQKEEELWRLFNLHKNEKILVYVYKKFNLRGVENLSEKANEKGFNSEFFHGNMTAQERNEIITRFNNNEFNIVFATNAFGMGIDIRDIRVVIHYSMPETIEQYYQEVGRAARDNRIGGTAMAYLLYSDRSIDTRKEWIENSYPDRKKILEVYEKISNNKTGMKTLFYYDDEDIQECLPYYFNSGLISYICKGFSDLKNVNMDCIEDDFLKKAIQEAKIPIIKVLLAKNTDINPKDFVEIVYEDLINEKISLKKKLDKIILIDVKEPTLSEEKLVEILKDIEEKKQYRNSQFELFVSLVEKNLTSRELQQEIANYFDVDKHQRDRIYATTKGDLVRSKSEVIIANLLYQYHIQYEYEQKIVGRDGEVIEPDFTIYLANGEKMYWEHLGMIGFEEYDQNWIRKLKVYEKYGWIKRLIKTYDNPNLTNSVLGIINQNLN